VLEIPLAIIIMRRARRPESVARILFVTLLANVLTHPALWYVPYLAFPWLFLPRFYPFYVAGGELAVVLVEAVVYLLLLVRGRPLLALAMSALANAASIAGGLLLWRILG
jgi:hypothetical protein